MTSWIYWGCQECRDLRGNHAVRLVIMVIIGVVLIISFPIHWFTSFSLTQWVLEACTPWEWPRVKFVVDALMGFGLICLALIHTRTPRICDLHSRRLSPKLSE